MPKTVMLAAFFVLSAAACTEGERSSSPLSASLPAPQPSEEVTERWTGTGWSPAYRTRWTYERLGAEATYVLNQARVEDEWVDASREVWTVDLSGRQTRGTGYEWQDNLWVERSHLAYFYDPDGHKVAARRRSLDESASADSLASTFEEGLEVERQFFGKEDGMWTERLRQHSSYDAEGLEVERVHLAPTEEGWTPQRRWTFRYDAYGVQQRSLVEEWTEEAWGPWLKQTYVYDGEGRQTGVVHEEWDGTAWVNMMRNTTRYDI